MRKGAPTVLAYAEGANGSPANVLDTGKLTVLDNQVDPTTGTIKLKATFPNPGDRLWPGAFVGVRLLVRTAENAAVVPPAAVQRGPQGTYVFLVTGDAVKLQPVTVGHEDAQASIITAALKPGDKVVVDGASRLSNGSRVELVSPAPAGPAAGAGAPRARPARARTGVAVKRGEVQLLPCPCGRGMGGRVVRSTTQRPGRARTTAPLTPSRKGGESVARA